MMDDVEVADELQRDDEPDGKPSLTHLLSGATTTARSLTHLFLDAQCGDAVPVGVAEEHGIEKEVIIDLMDQVADPMGELDEGASMPRTLRAAIQEIEDLRTQLSQVRPKDYQGHVPASIAQPLSEEQKNLD